MIENKFSTLLMICALVSIFGLSYLTIAAPPNVGIAGLKKIDANRPDAPWITNWWALDGPITNNGGHPAGSSVDWLDKGTKGKLTDKKVSTWNGLQLTKKTKVKLPNNGGEFGWDVITITPNDGNNMSTAYGLAPQDNIDTYAMLVINSSKAHTATMSPTHDDHGQIWLNGTKVYGNSAWTGAATEVDYDVPVKLDKGANVLLFRCSEGGGSDYFNLHFDDNTKKILKIFPTATGNFWSDMRRLSFPVEPNSKLATKWGDVKFQK